MKRFLLLLFLLPYTENITAQNVISGQVIFAEDKKPVALASVFLSNTSVGTVTLPDGSFRLNTTAAGRYDLIVSFVGYETIQKSISIPSEEASGILIALKPKPRQLDEVVIGEYEEQSWKRWGSFFINQFIGYGSWADQCKLHNFEKIHFLYSKRKKILKAYCDEQFVIINKKLDYRITYKLEKFQYNFATGVLFYAGFPLFEELESKGKTGSSTGLMHVIKPIMVQ
ncbi:MAG: carboxypeptidase-like regulatory domain-containing protein [Lacibacter sp.]